MAAAIIAAAAAAQQRYLRAFRRAGATDAEHACTLAEVGLKESRTFRKLVDDGYLIAAPKGYYVNEERVELHRQRELTASLIVTGILTVLAIVLVLMKK